MKTQGWWKGSWLLNSALGLMSIVGLALLFSLANATSSPSQYERNYTLLFGLNVAMVVVLTVVIVSISVNLLLKLRRRAYGSRLLLKLAAIFGLVGLLPGLLIYVVSYQFVSRSIESWFDAKVEKALVAGLNLGTLTLEQRSEQLSDQLRSVAATLAHESDARASLALNDIRDKLDASDVVLWSGNGVLLGSVGQSQYSLSVEKPSATQSRALIASTVKTQFEGLDDALSGGAAAARIKGWVAVPAPVAQLGNQARILQVTVPLPPALVSNAVAVQEANREYQERVLGQQGLRRMYIGTLTLSLFLAVFGALVLALLLGNQLAKPLLMLADGVRKVAAGDLSPNQALQGSDELDGLTRSFAAMTQQLADARVAVDRSMGEVGAARAHLQTILDNMTAGVIVLDDGGRIVSSNPGSTRILRAPIAAHDGDRLSDIDGLNEFGEGVHKQFTAMADKSEFQNDHWQQSFVLYGGPEAPMGHTEAVTVVARGAELPQGQRLLVFDDISEIVSAQRAQAWGEVARRVAHEIKNPLTPIQLSAERMAMRLHDKLPEPEQAILNKSVKTIVDQVDAMKRLVNDFRDYARLPAAQLQPTDLNALIQDVLQLYPGADGAASGFELSLDPASPPIPADAQQLRQVLHNLLQNAQDANSEATDQQGATVKVTTLYNPTSQRVRLTISDQGKGFPDAVMRRAFEPYVTTKVKGTGLGLAVVKKIVEEHGARIELSNRLDAQGAVTGAQVSVSFATATHHSA